MNNVSIGFSTPFSWNPLSALIRRLTGARVSHVWLVYYDYAFEQTMVLEAHDTGFRIISYGNFRIKNNVIKLVPITHDLKGGIINAGKLLGAPYDITGLLGMSVVMAGRWLKRKWRNPFGSKRALFCSEVIVRVLQHSQFPGSSKLSAENTTPQDILDFLDKDNNSCSKA